MKICVIGAGITGLTIGRLLSKVHDVVIYERELSIGGIAKTKTINGVSYHPVGGHCFNSKNQAVLDFIFSEVLPKEEWNCIKRVAVIYFHDHFIPYPIEFSIREIAMFNEELAFRIVKDFFSTQEREVDNLADWFRVNFGETLANEYFIPYNRKVWKMEPAEMSWKWVYGKLPIPNKREFFKALIKGNEDDMPHRFFFYPKTNNMNTFIEKLGEGLNIIKNFEVISIEKKGNKWIINDSYEYDLVISTIPLNTLPRIIKGVPNAILEEAKKLRYNKVTTVLWRTKPIDFTWTYYPSPDTIFHRHIHIGNFFVPKQNYTITECIGEYSYEEIIEHGKKFDYLLEPIDFNISDHAYIVYDRNYEEATTKIKEYLKSIGIYTIGRFGEWKYYNMDICIESAMKLAKILI